MPSHPMPMSGTYDWRLVALSIFLAIAASYAALDIAGRITATHRRARAYWLVGGAVAMGSGIWAMHYIGMLAFHMDMPVLYDFPTVLLSLLAAILASAIALFIVSRSRMGLVEELIGSLFMGSGITAMHYIGMEAMRVPAKIAYDWRLVACSVLLAVVISLVALILTFRVRDEKRTSRRKIISALLMGSAIPIMHYTGMGAARFYATDKAPDLSHAVSISSLGVVAISVTSFLVLALAIATAFLDRLLAAQKAVLALANEREAYSRCLAETIPQIVWTTDANGHTDYFNQRWYDYTGIDAGQVDDASWQLVIHSEDLPLVLQKWQQAVQTGETYEIECRFRRASDETYRWHLNRALPMTNAAGNIEKWFGTCTDIDEKKRHSQILEEQVKQRTAQVLAASRRLEEEMQERASAQRELNERNALTLRELKELSARTALLSEMGKLLQSSSNLQEAFSIVTGWAPKLFPEFRGALVLLSTNRNRLEVAGSWSDCELRETSFEMEECWALRTGNRHIVEAGNPTAQCAHASAVACSYFCIPIMAQGRALGILHFQTKTASCTPSEADVSLSGTFAEQVGLSIVNLKLQEALRIQSTRDALTGLYNRRYLEENFEREIRRAGRTEQPVGVVMFDLDHFKQFNDTFGHDAGDAVLREVGALLSRNSRVEDIPCRYGGEEFILILPGADPKGTQIRAEKLRRQLRELKVLHQGKSVGTITVSAGIAGFPTDGLSVREIIMRADAALYCAKAEGRDRVILAGRVGIGIRDSLAVSAVSTE